MICGGMGRAGSDLAFISGLSHPLSFLVYVYNKHTRCCGKARSSGSLSAAELNAAETLWLAIAQFHTFQEELESLRTKKAIPNASSLRTLHPFLNNLG